MAHAHEELARIALAEDAPAGDITSQATIPEATSCAAELVIKQDGVLAGLEAAVAVFEAAAADDGTTVEIDRKAADGDRVRAGDRAALLRGDARTMLRAERPAAVMPYRRCGIPCGADACRPPPRPGGAPHCPRGDSREDTQHPRIAGPHAEAAR